MKTNANSLLLESYFNLLRGLDRENKILLVAKLSNSIVEEQPDKNGVIDKLFGSFESDKTAEEIIRDIKESRTFNRNIEAL